MKYNVSINEKSKTITVELDGYKGVAKCCDTDQFNITTGIELALERAKVAKATAIKEKEAKLKNPTPSIMELVKALEKALPKGQMVLVGNGEGLTAEQKKWLHSLTDCKCCKCGGYTEADIEEAYNEGHDDGYAEGMADANPDDRYDEGYDDGHADGYDEGYSDAKDEYEEEVSADDLAERVREVMAELLG